MHSTYRLNRGLVLDEYSAPAGSVHRCMYVKCFVVMPLSWRVGAIFDAASVGIYAYRLLLDCCFGKTRQYEQTVNDFPSVLRRLIGLYDLGCV